MLRSYGNPTTPSQLFIPASRMTQTSGTPGLAGFSAVPVWQFDQTAIETVSTSIDVASEMPGWQTATAELVWANSAESAGDVFWRLDSGPVSVGQVFVTPSIVGGGISTAGAMSFVIVFPIAGVVPIVAGSLLALRIYRLGSNGSDTLPNDANLLGVRLRRAT